MTDDARTVAAFDFDGTLTRHDTLVPFLACVVGWPRVLAALAIDSPRLALMAAGRGDRDAAKERMLVRLLRGVPYDRVAASARAYGERLVARKVRPEMRDRIAWHRREGHAIVIVSASLDVYLAEVAGRLAVDAVLCTALEVDDRGRCTGRMLGGNCRGPEKARRLRDYLGAGDVTLWAYGDSAGDDELLAMADHAITGRSWSAHPRT